MQKTPVGYVNTTGVNGINQVLEQTNHTAGFEIQVDVIKSRAGGQARHGGHLAAQGVDEPCPDRCAHIPDR